MRGALHGRGQAQGQARHRDPAEAPPLAPLKKLAEKSGDTEMSAEDKVLKEFTADILTDNNLAADDDDDEDDEEDAIATLAGDGDGDDDDVLAEADIDKSKITDE